MKNRFDLLVFDWDGTLFDSIHWIVECLNVAARDCNLPIPADRLARSVIGLSLERAMATLFPGATESDIESLMGAYVRYYANKTIGPECLFPGVAEMLATLRAEGYQLAVATGKTRQGLDHAMAAAGASGWFHATRAAGETASKPDPMMLFELMAELKTPPERTLMVGDSIYDLQMARNAGASAVGVYGGAHDRGELQALSPLLGLERTVELLDWLI